MDMFLSLAFHAAIKLLDFSDVEIGRLALTGATNLMTQLTLQMWW